MTPGTADTDRVRFETPEDVDLSFQLAGPGSRAAAALIDHTIVALIVAAMIAVLGAAGVVAFRVRDLFDPDTLMELSGFAIAVLVSAVFAVSASYFIGSEWLLGGQSLGKRMMEIRVVRDGGYGISLTASLLRNSTRIVDLLPGIYLVGLISILASREKKRLGDFIAGTIVVRVEQAAAPKPRFVGLRYATLEGRRFDLTRVEVSRAGAGALALLDGYFDRVESLAEAEARSLTQAVATGLARRMGVDLDKAGADEARHADFLREAYIALREAAG